MKLSELNRKQLDKLAVKYKLEVHEAEEDELVRKQIAEAIKEKRSGGWPVEWREDMREEYFRSIVGKDMPDDPAKAYKILIAAIDKVVPTAKPTQTPVGPDCWGIAYDPKADTCMKQCPTMPLCRAIKQRRPDFKDLLKEIEQVAAESEGVDAAEALDAHASKVKPKKEEKEEVEEKEAKPEKKKKVRRYKWTGDIKAFLKGVDVDDEELLNIYRWIAKAKSFTKSELIGQFAENFDDANGLAADTITFLLNGGDISRV